MPCSRIGTLDRQAPLPPGEAGCRSVVAVVVVDEAVMHCKQIASLFFVLLFGMLASPASGADNAAIVGTWRITSFSILTLETNEVTHPNARSGSSSTSPAGTCWSFSLQGIKRSPLARRIQMRSGQTLTSQSSRHMRANTQLKGIKLFIMSSGLGGPDWVGIDLVRFFRDQW